MRSAAVCIRGKQPLAQQFRCAICESCVWVNWWKKKPVWLQRLLVVLISVHGYVIPVQVRSYSGFGIGVVVVW